MKKNAFTDCHLTLGNSFNNIQRGTYSPQLRELVMTFLKPIGADPFDNPIARQVAPLLRGKCEQVLDFVIRVERPAQKLQSQPLDFTLFCR